MNVTFAVLGSCEIGVGIAGYSPTLSLSWLWVLGGFASVLVIASVTNLNRWRYCGAMLELYNSWAREPRGTPLRHELYNWLVDQRQRLAEYRRLASIPDRRIVINEPVGYGHVMQGTSSAWTHWVSGRKDAYVCMVSDLRSMRGYFRRRAWTVWHPYSWAHQVVAVLRGAVRVIKS